MTRDEVKRVMALVRTLWPHSVIVPPEVDTGTAVDVWAKMLAGTEYREADAALQELAGERDQAPPVGMLVRRCAERRLNVPPWESVWPELERMSRSSTQPDGRHRIPPAREFSHPFVASFARARWRDLCPLPRAESMGTLRAQMRDAYSGELAQAQRDEALEAVGLPRRRGGPLALPSGG